MLHCSIARFDVVAICWIDRGRDAVGGFIGLESKISVGGIPGLLPMNTGPDKNDPSRLSWGPSAWIFLQSAVYLYPDSPSQAQKRIYKTFLKSACAVLPCDICRKSTCAYLKQHPVEPYLECRQALIVWIYKIHHLVNLKLGKRSCSFIEFVKRYQKMRAKCSRARKGCTEAFQSHGDEDIEVWAKSALKKYWNYADEEKAWRVRNRLKWSGVVIILLSLVAIVYRIQKRYKLVLRRISLQK